MRQSFHSDRVIPGWRLCSIVNFEASVTNAGRCLNGQFWKPLIVQKRLEKTFSDAREKSCCVGSSEGSNGRLGTIWIFMLSVPGIGQVPAFSLFLFFPLCLSCFSLDEVCRLSCLWLFGALCTVAFQAPLSMGFSRQEYWSGLQFPPPEDLLDSGIEPKSLASPALAGRFFALCYLGSPLSWWCLAISYQNSICLCL